MNHKTSHDERIFQPRDQLSVEIVLEERPIEDDAIIPWTTICLRETSQWKRRSFTDPLPYKDFPRKKIVDFLQIYRK